MSQPVVEGNTIIVLIVGGNSEQCSLARQWFTKPSPFFFFCNCISLDNTKENCFFFCNGAILHSLTFTIAIEQQIALNCLLHSGQMSIQCNSDEFVFIVFVFVLVNTCICTFWYLTNLCSKDECKQIIAQCNSDYLTAHNRNCYCGVKLSQAYFICYCSLYLCVLYKKWWRTTHFYMWYFVFIDNVCNWYFVWTNCHW